MSHNIIINYEFTDLSSKDWKRNGIFSNITDITNDCCFGHTVGFPVFKTA